MAPVSPRRVRPFAIRVVAAVSRWTLLRNIRSQDARRLASALQVNQLEELALARAWGFESPLPHQPRSRLHSAVKRSERLTGGHGISVYPTPTHSPGPSHTCRPLHESKRRWWERFARAARGRLFTR